MTDSGYSISFPYGFGADGLAARVDRTTHIGDLLEQLLFTRQGERLVRPTLGCGLPDLLFGPASPETAEAARLTIQVAVQEFLSREIELTALDVRAEESALIIDISYVVRATGEDGTASFRAETGGGP
jgi:Bacteriophage baseplate protein W